MSGETLTRKFLVKSQEKLTHNFLTYGLRYTLCYCLNLKADRGLCQQKMLKTRRVDMHWQRIEDIRIDHDLTQQDIANMLHCQREVYRRYEKGIRELPLSYAIILAKYYNVSLDYLVGLTDKK